jgi:hypothetical protein
MMSSVQELTSKLDSVESVRNRARRGQRQLQLEVIQRERSLMLFSRHGTEVILTMITSHE